MRVAAGLLLLLWSAGSCLGQETGATSTTAPVNPDYSPQALRSILFAEAPHPVPRGNVRWHIGSVDFTLFGEPFRITFIPFLPALPGSGLGTTRQMIDPFALTNTPFPYVPNSRERRRAHQKLERELRAGARKG